MVIQSVITSSLEKVFPEQTPAACTTPFTMLKNDTFSFQAALRPVSIPGSAEMASSSVLCQDGSARADDSIPVKISAASPVAAQISLRRVDLMPSTLPVNDTRDGNFISDGSVPGSSDAA